MYGAVTPVQGAPDTLHDSKIEIVHDAVMSVKCMPSGGSDVGMLW